MLTVLRLMAPPGLNVSGENLVTRVISEGAVHISCGSDTQPHAHYAWKLHIGLDSPVWLDSPLARVPASEGCRAVVVPPGLVHRVGAVGLSCTAFAAPGSRGAPFIGGGAVSVLDALKSRQVVDLGWKLLRDCRLSTTDYVAALFRVVFAPSASARTDPRVRRALTALREDPDRSLHALSAMNRLSSDRLSHLIKESTGITARQHAVWSRLLRLLSQPRRYTNLTEAALAAGFSDHAHMTRTYRRFLGRLPSEFSAPPDVLEPW